MSLAATRLDPWRLRYDASNLDFWEHRLSNYGAFATFQSDTPNLIPGYQELIANRTAEVRTRNVNHRELKALRLGLTWPGHVYMHAIQSAVSVTVKFRFNPQVVPDPQVI